MNYIHHIHKFNISGSTSILNVFNKNQSNATNPGSTAPSLVFLSIYFHIHTHISINHSGIKVSN